MKIILLGDSITQGLGSKKVNFVKALEERLGDKYAIVNFAMTGSTIHYANEIAGRIIEENPKLVINLYGNVDAQLRVNREGLLFKHLPGRFGSPNGSMILPRPFYSHIWYKSLLQHIENGIRTIFRNLIYRVDGTEQWVPLAEFKVCYERLSQTLMTQGIPMMVCSTVYIDDKLFPGSQEQYQVYNSFLKQYAIENSMAYIDFYNLLKRMVEKEGWKKYYNHDHFHPNGTGYLVMAKKIAETIGTRENGYT